MKKNTIRVLALLMALLTVLCLASCKKTPSVEKTGLWENATYLKDTSFGKGEKTVQVEVKAEEQSITFTLHTDKTTLGDVLLEHKLVSGDVGDYGLYVDTVNGIRADYSVNQSYWAFYQNGEMMQVGVDGATLVGGEHFELVYEIYAAAN